MNNKTETTTVTLHDAGHKLLVSVIVSCVCSMKFWTEGRGRLSIQRMSIYLQCSHFFIDNDADGAMTAG